MQKPGTYSSERQGFGMSVSTSSKPSMGLKCGGSMSETRLIPLRARAIAPTSASQVVPAIVAAAGDNAARRYLEFFAVTIENPNAASLLSCLPAVLRLVRAQRPR